MLCDDLKKNRLKRLALMQPLQNQRETWFDIQAALQSNTSVTDVYIGAYFDSHLPSEQVAVIVQSLAEHVPRMQIFSMGTLEQSSNSYSGIISSTASSSRTPVARIPGRIMGSMLQASRYLQTLRIERQVLFRDSDEVQALAQGIMEHPTLRRISLPRLHPSFGGPSPQGNGPPEPRTNEDNEYGMTLHSTDQVDAKYRRVLDPLLIALSRLPQLESLQLGLSDESLSWHGSVCTPSALSSLARPTWRQSSPQAPNHYYSSLLSSHNKKGLGWLVLHRLRLTDDHVERLCQALTGENTLLAKTPAGGSGSLINSQPSGCPSLANPMISSLHTLELGQNREITSRSWRAMVTMMKHQRIQLQSDHDGAAVRPPVPADVAVDLEALELQCLEDDKEAWKYKRQAQFYLKLNHLGRRRHLRSGSLSRDEWLQLVAKHFAHDLSSVALLVRENPWICIS